MTLGLKGFQKGNKIHQGKRYSVEHRNKISAGHKGKTVSEDTKKKISEAQRGAKSHFWKGGVTKMNQIIRGSLEYSIWRESVFRRDKYTCIWCGAKNQEGIGKSIKLHADHVKPFAYFPELRFGIDNGRTLCVPCHKTTDTYAGKIRRQKYE